MPLVTYTGTKISTRWNQELGKGEKQGSSHTTGKLNWYSFFGRQISNIEVNNYTLDIILKNYWFGENI